MDWIRQRLGLRRGDTVATVLERNRNVGPGFDWLRIALAGLIFYSHAKYIAGQIVVPHTSNPGASLARSTLETAGHQTPTHILAAEGGWSGWHRPIAVALVPMFFALSGFLVTGSALRLRRTSTFLAFRALRILPALTTEVFLSALVLGPLLTSVSVSNYFSDPLVLRYFGNIIGDITYRLPGLFLANPALGTVNLNLWTLPGEFYCYAAMAIAMILTIVYRRAALLIALLVATLILAPLNLFTEFDVVPAALPTHDLAFYFLVGVTFYLWRDRVPVALPLFGLSAAIAFGLLLSKHTVYLAPVFLTYCTVVIGMVRLPKSRLIASGDYSYGIYLYGFPIMQATIALAPWLQRRWLSLMLIAGTLTCLFAAASWHLIEKPALRLKKFLPERLFPRAPRSLPIPPLS